MYEYARPDEIYPYDRTDFLIRSENPQNRFTDTWTQIISRLHENSGLRRSENGVSEVLDDVIGKSLEAFDSFIDDHLLQAYILTAEGTHLDRLGEEWGVYRLKNKNKEEPDDKYRRRILNSIVYTISLVFLKRQGFKAYSKKETNFNSRTKMTSSNPHSSNKYDFVPISAQAYKFLIDDIIFEDSVQVHIKGWD